MKTTWWFRVWLLVKTEVGTTDLQDFCENREILRSAKDLDNSVKGRYIYRQLSQSKGLDSVNGNKAVDWRNGVHGMEGESKDNHNEENFKMRKSVGLILRRKVVGKDREKTVKRR